jgi:hypothetical protein
VFAENSKTPDHPAGAKPAGTIKYEQRRIPTVSVGKLPTFR